MSKTGPLLLNIDGELSLFEVSDVEAINNGESYDLKCEDYTVSDSIMARRTSFDVFRLSEQEYELLREVPSHVFEEAKTHRILKVAVAKSKGLSLGHNWKVQFHPSMEDVVYNGIEKLVTKTIELLKEEK